MRKTTHWFWPEWHQYTFLLSLFVIKREGSNFFYIMQCRATPLWPKQVRCFAHRFGTSLTKLTTTSNRQFKIIQISDTRLRLVTSDGDIHCASTSDHSDMTQQQQQCGYGLMPYTASVIDLIKVGSKAGLIVVVSDQSSQFRGPIILEDTDESIFEFNSFAETIEDTPNFRPSIGSIVAALSSSDSVWKRGYVTKVLESSYNVHFVDYGNDDSVVAVKPIPASYQHETMSVRLSFVGDLTSATKDFVNQKMIEFKGHPLEITSKMADGSFLAKFIGENFPTCVVKIESWASTLTETDVSPASPAPFPNISFSEENTNEEVAPVDNTLRNLSYENSTETKRLLKTPTAVPSTPRVDATNVDDSIMKTPQVKAVALEEVVAEESSEKFAVETTSEPVPMESAITTDEPTEENAIPVAS